jgi:hypothetical protein
MMIWVSPSLEWSGGKCGKIQWRRRRFCKKEIPFGPSQGTCIFNEPRIALFFNGKKFSILSHSAVSAVGGEW